jgi:cell wall-associated NlpC family hydrolase
VEGPLWARNWAKFGKAADKGQLGDVLVFRRAYGSGHVGLYVGEDYGAYHVLGGNQSDGVTITRIAKDRCISVRRPPYHKAPVTAKPMLLAATGILSVNEA